MESQEGGRDSGGEEAYLVLLLTLCVVTAGGGGNIKSCWQTEHIHCSLTDYFSSEKQSASF